LQRLVHRLARHHVRGLQLQLAVALVGDVRAPVDGLAERVDHAAEVSVPDGHGEHAPRPLDLLPLFDAGEVAEHHHTDVPDVEVQRDAERAVLELQQLVGHRRGQPLDVRDTVAGVGDDADLLLGDLRLVRGDVALERAADLLGRDGQLGHPQLPSYLSTWCGQRPARALRVSVSRRATVPSYRSWPTCTRMPPRTSGSIVIFRLTSRRYISDNLAPSLRSSSSVSAAATVT